MKQQRGRSRIGHVIHHGTTQEVLLDCLILPVILTVVGALVNLGNVGGACEWHGQYGGVYPDNTQHYCSHCSRIPDTACFMCKRIYASTYMYKAGRCTQWPQHLSVRSGQSDSPLRPLPSALSRVCCAPGSHPQSASQAPTVMLTQQAAAAVTQQAA